MNNKYSLCVKECQLDFILDNFNSKFWLKRKFMFKKIHEIKVVELLCKLLKPKMICVDVGAHIGFFSLFLSKNCSDGTIYAFEMDKTNYTTLKINIEMNKCNNIKHYNLAIADYKGFTEYKTSFVLTHAMSQLTRNIKSNQYLAKKIAETTTLDEFFSDKSDKPNIVKIDVEGSELKVLKGMNNILDDENVHLIIEIHPRLLKRNFNSQTKDVLNLLFNKHFNIYEITNFRKKEGKLQLKIIKNKTKISFNKMLFATKSYNDFSD